MTRSSSLSQYFRRRRRRDALTECKVTVKTGLGGRGAGWRFIRLTTGEGVGKEGLDVGWGVYEIRLEKSR